MQHAQQDAICFSLQDHRFLQTCLKWFESVFIEDIELFLIIKIKIMKIKSDSYYIRSKDIISAHKWVSYADKYFNFLV